MIWSRRGMYWKGAARISPVTNNESVPEGPQKRTKQSSVGDSLVLHLRKSSSVSLSTFCDPLDFKYLGTPSSHGCIACFPPLPIETRPSLEGPWTRNDGESSWRRRAARSIIALGKQSLTMEAACLLVEYNLTWLPKAVSRDEVCLSSECRSCCMRLCSRAVNLCSQPSSLEHSMAHRFLCRRFYLMRTANRPLASPRRSQLS